MGNQWTTFFVTAMWIPLCGILSSLNLVCLELCLEELSTCLFTDGILKGPGVLRFGRWCIMHFLVCVEGINLRCVEDVESSMDDILALFFHILYLWTMAFLSPMLLIFVNFLTCFSLPS